MFTGTNLSSFLYIYRRLYVRYGYPNTKAIELIEDYYDNLLSRKVYTMFIEARNLKDLKRIITTK